MASRGDRLGGRYVLIEPIGNGGMAVVWRARDARLGRQVAVKILRPQFGEDADFARRFQSEARHAASLSHPNIATVFDADSDGETQFIVMELVDGPTLAEVLERNGRLSPLEAVELAAAAARALAAAHRRGLVHRDVKPANLLIGRDGRVRLADFGIARALTTSRLTMPGTVLGSLRYMSPEQARGEEATPADDIFSLGVVLFETVKGRLPWPAEAPASMSTRWLEDPVVPAVEPGGPAADPIDAILARALNPDPQQRFSSAQAFADALEAAARTVRRTKSHAFDDRMDMAAAGAGANRARTAEPSTTNDRRHGRLADAPGGAWSAVARANPGAKMVAVVPPTAHRLPVPQPTAPASTPGSDAVASVGRHRVVAVEAESDPFELEERRRRAGALLAVAALFAFFAVAAFRLDPSDRGAIAGADPTAPPASSVAAIPTTTAATESQSAAPTPIPTPATPPPTRGPSPAPTATAPSATPLSTTPLGLSPQSSAVVAFYDAVEAHDWDAAIPMWSDSMQERYPPDEWLIGRFSRTTRIDVLGVNLVTSTPTAATVAVRIREYRDVEPSPRLFVGDWDLVLVDGRWLLDDPDF